MNKFKIIFFSILISNFISCKDYKQGLTGTKIENPQESKIIETKLTLTNFKEIPEEIEGCSCYFSNDSTEFKKGEYIYVNDFAQTSFLKINGVMTKFTQTDFKKIGTSNTKAKYTSDNYEMTIEVTDDKSSGDEISLKSGTIRVIGKNGKTITKTFYGECGC